MPRGRNRNGISVLPLGTSQVLLAALQYRVTLLLCPVFSRRVHFKGKVDCNISFKGTQQQDQHLLAQLWLAAVQARMTMLLCSSVSLEGSILMVKFTVN